jgi:dihydropteroate synthase
LLVQVDRALAAGVEERSLILDPGLGFAKDASHNWLLLRRLRELTALGLPVLVGASRKRFLGQLLAGADGALRPPADREAATAAVSMLVAADGAWGIRVHEPRPTRDALAVLSSVRAGRSDAQACADTVLSAADRAGARFGRLAPQGSAHG